MHLLRTFKKPSPVTLIHVVPRKTIVKKCLTLVTVILSQVNETITNKTRSEQAVH